MVVNDFCAGAQKQVKITFLPCCGPKFRKNAVRFVGSIDTEWVT